MATKKEHTETPAVPTEADIKKIVNRLHRRAAEIAEAGAQIECAQVALRNLKAKRDKLVAEQDADEEMIRIWGRANPKKFESAAKGAVDLGKAVVTLKSNPASIKNIDGWTDDDVIAACEKTGHDEYVRVQKKLERAVIKSDWNAQRINDKELRKLGLYPDCAAKYEIKLKD